MTTKYRTEDTRWRIEAKITPVEVTRETDNFVWVKGGSRQGKVTGYCIFHDTWEAAHAHLLQKSEEQVAAARRRLEEAEGYHGNVKGMKKPQ